MVGRFVNIVDWKEAISGLSQILIGGGIQAELFKAILDGSMQERLKRLLWTKMVLMETNVPLPIWVWLVLLVYQLHLGIL
jgi:hypothetical protein